MELLSWLIKADLNSQELIPQELNGHISIGVYLNMECDVSHELKKKSFEVFIIYSWNPLWMYQSVFEAVQEKK